ncbi:MAG: RNA polymerase sigma factor [Polyangiaceae bacterium]
MMPEPPYEPAVAEDDETLLARILAGERMMFEPLMRRYNQRLFRVARAVLKSDHEAEDVVQDAWFRAFENLGQFEGRSSFGTWVTRICIHEALARARRAGRFVSFEPEGVQEASTMAGSNPEADMSNVEMRKVLEGAIDGLPDPFRAAFVLRAVEQMSVTEVSELLGIPEDTVRTRTFRARALLQTQITKQLDSATLEAFSFAGDRCDRIVANVLRRIARR